MDERKSVERNNGLDILKFICAFLVICIHATFTSREYVEPLTRAAVPVFFMISGYFSADKVKVQQIKRILRIFLLWFVIYTLWCIFTAYTKGIAAMDLISSWLNPETLWNLVLLNKVPVAGHLWYLSALLYVLIIVHVFKRWINWLYRSIPVLLGGALLLGTYSYYVFGSNFPVMYSRNFLLTGLPFYLIGALIKEREGSLRLKSSTVGLVLLLSLLCTYLESLLLKRTRGFADADLYISTVFFSASLLLFFKEKRCADGNSIAGKCAKWGKSCSLWIYLLHPIVLQMMPSFFNPFFVRIPLSLEIYRHCEPLIALCLSTAIAVVIEIVKTRMQRRTLLEEKP